MCHSFLTGVGFLFKRRNVAAVRVTLVGSNVDSVCSDALHSCFHKVAHQAWSAYPHLQGKHTFGKRNAVLQVLTCSLRTIFIRSTEL